MMASEGGKGARPALREVLGSLNAALAECRRKMGAEARPAAGLIEEIGRRAGEACAALEGLQEAAAGLPEAERLDLIREAAAARAHLAVVARLAAGGAWFASLAREMDGSPRGGLYGRGGTAPAGETARSRVERKA